MFVDIATHDYVFIMQEMYSFCHQALVDYVDSFETYANFKELV